MTLKFEFLGEDHDPRTLVLENRLIKCSFIARYKRFTAFPLAHGDIESVAVPICFAVFLCFFYIFQLHLRYFAKVDG